MIITARRAQPIKVAGQVEKVLIKFGIRPYRGSRLMRTEMVTPEMQEALNNPLETHFVLTPDECAKAKPGVLCRDITDWPPDPEPSESLPGESFDDYFDRTFDPTLRSSVDVLSQDRDGGNLELEIVLEDESQAPELIRELRMCGYVCSMSDASQDE